jgi:hypothetical protein
VDESFDDERSILVELQATPGELREYVLRLDAPSLRARFPADREIHQVQIRPLDAKGEIELGPIEFCE